MNAANLAGDVRVLAERLRSSEQLDRIAEPASEFINRTIDKYQLRDKLSGKWLGHPVHPALTDLPIGFWTSAMLVDFLGGKKRKRAATMLVAAGIASAVPTAMTGAHDFTELDVKDKRVGVGHALANSVALLFYIGSFFARVRGRRGRGVYLGVLGAAAATVGGYLGGHLVFGGGDTNDEAGDAPVDVREEQLTGQANGRPVVTTPSV